MTENRVFTTRELRYFGLILGGLLGLLGRKLYLKGWAAAPAVLTAAGLSAFLGLVWPAGLRPLMKPWMRMARVLAAVNTFAVLAIVYYLIITPFSLLMRLKDSDPLDERLDTGESYWKPKERREGLEHYERQF